MRPRFCCYLVAIAGAVVVIVPAQAQYPSKSVRVIVPGPPGGGPDASARIIGQGLSSALGRPVVIENRAGADQNIGAEIAARSPADGYTLLVASVAHTINVSLYSKLSYNLLRDFAPVSLLVSSPFVLTVHPSVPAKSVKDLITLARARPSQLDYATAGSGPHLAAALFVEMAGIKMNHVPYKGGGPAVIALMGGEVSVAFSSLVAATPHFKSGKLRGLAVTPARRSPSAPDIPTVNEAGVKGYEAGSWYGIMAPNGTPKDVITRLHGEFSKQLNLQDIKDRLSAAGVDPIGTTPEEFGVYIRSEIEKWGKVVKASGARPD